MDYDVDFNSKVDMNKGEMDEAEAVEAFASGNGALAQVKEDDNGNKRFFNVYGDVHDGVDHILNIFMDSAVINNLLMAMVHHNLNTSEKNEDEDKDKYIATQVTIDFIDQAIMWVLLLDKEKVRIEAYSRDEKKSFYSPAIEGEWKTTNGSLNITSEMIQEDNNLLYTAAFASVRKHLIAEGVVDQLRKINKYSAAGVLITAVDEDHIAYKIVQDRQRPDLVCSMFLLGEITCRPYLDEMIRGNRASNMSIEDNIKAANDGEIWAMEALANAYLNGDEVDQDFEESLKWWEKLAETGDATAQYNTGLYYAKGAGTNRDFKKAAEWMRKSAENGDEDAVLVVKTYEDADENLRKAQEGDADAQAEVAELYTKMGGSLEQYNTDSDYDEAFRWAKASADQGNPKGLYCLGLCYEHGRGTSRDFDKAGAAFQKAANMKHAPSQWKMAVKSFYYSDNEDEGLRLAYESAEQGFELAISGLEERGLTVDGIIDYYNNPENIVTLEGTQYEGRADRCERIKVDDELTYKITKDKNGKNTLELFYNGKTVGLTNHYAVWKIIALLNLKKVDLKVTVRSCIPKSKRGPRARNAEVTLNMILSEIRNETPEEREERLALEAARRKEAEEKARIEAEKRKAEEEARKKAEEEAKVKKREQAESKALDMVEEARRSYKKLEATWRDRLDAHQDQVSSKTYTSMDEVTRNMRGIVLDRNSYGTKYDDLIKDIDSRGKKYLNDGCSYIAVRGIRDIITEIIDNSSALDIDFSMTGMSTAEIGSTEFEVSQSSKSIQRWWNSKYEDMPEVQAEKKKKQLLDDLKAAEMGMTAIRKERSDLDTKEKTLEQDISVSEQSIKELESGYEESKARIESELASTLQRLQEKIDALKADKAAAEKSISDMQAQIAGLSFFKFGLKKELTQKVENARAGLPRFTEDIRRVEAECEETKRKCNSDIASLQQKIDDEKSILSGKKGELSALPEKKTELDVKVEAAIKKVEDLKARIANL